jgi:hypothetical protein
MDNITEEISASYFRRFASLHPEIWHELIGQEIIHTVWGKCKIQSANLAKAVIQVSSHPVSIDYFEARLFSGVKVSSELAATILAFIKKKDEQDAEDEKLLAERQRSKELEEQAIREVSRKLEIEETERIKVKVRQERLLQLEEQKARERIEREQAEAIKILELQRKAAHELKELAEKQERAKTIRSFCRVRSIYALLHFTRIENLESILTHGLVSRLQLGAMNLPTPILVNDKHRLDGYPNAISLSICHTNYQMFYKYNSLNQHQWVVLVLEPYILWEFECAFFETNAASNAMKHLSLPHRKDYQSLERMFTDQPNVVRSGLGIPNYYPTNPQAEVLVFEPIPPQYITAVNFYDENAKDGFLPKGVRGDHHPIISTSREYFGPRIDYPAWQKTHKNNYCPDNSISNELPSFDEEFPF